MDDIARSRLVHPGDRHLWLRGPLRAHHRIYLLIGVRQADTFLVYGTTLKWGSPRYSGAAAEVAPERLQVGAARWGLEGY